MWESVSEHFGHYLPIHNGNLHIHIQSRSDIETERLLSECDCDILCFLEASKGSERTNETVFILPITVCVLSETIQFFYFSFVLNSHSTFTIVSIHSFVRKKKIIRAIYRSQNYPQFIVDHKPKFWTEKI